MRRHVCLPCRQRSAQWATHHNAQHCYLPSGGLSVHWTTTHMTDAHRPVGRSSREDTISDLLMSHDEFSINRWNATHCSQTFPHEHVREVCPIGDVLSDKRARILSIRHHMTEECHAQHHKALSLTDVAHRHISQVSREYSWITNKQGFMSKRPSPP